MKLMRYGPVGHERPALMDASGNIRDLSGVLPDITPEALSSKSLSRLAAIDATSLPVVDGHPRIGTPVAGTGKFIAIGLNFADHAAESNLPLPTEPVVFMKATSCIVGPDDDVLLPRRSEKTDWEVELGFVVGKRSAYVAKADALSHIAGFVLINDVSERAYQIERGGTWDKGKGCDTFGPVGPWLVTTDEIGDAGELGMWLDVNGERRQTGNTRTMVFDCATILSYVSEFMTLMPGDIVTTGTPPGVGLGMKPPMYLKAGDVMTLGIDRLGQQRQRVVAWKESA